MNQYDVGDLVRITMTFLNVSGVLTSPSTVSLRLKDPGGTVTTPSAVNDSTGAYHFDVNVNLAGTWTYYIAATGTLQTAGSGRFNALKDPTS